MDASDPRRPNALTELRRGVVEYCVMAAIRDGTPDCQGHAVTRPDAVLPARLRQIDRTKGAELQQVGRESVAHRT